MNLYQYHLESDPMEMVCWIDYKHKLAVGTRLTLKAFGPMEWRVKAVYDTKRMHPADVKWEVGGLG